MSGRHALVIGSQCDALPNQRLSFLPNLVEDLYAELTNPASGDCDDSASRLLLDPSLPELSEAVKSAISAAASAEAVLIFVFVGHGETLGDDATGTDLYLLPRTGQVQPDSDTGYLLGQRLREILAGPLAVGLNGLLVLLDVCHAGLGALNTIQRAATFAAASKARLEVVASTFTRVARRGCFSTAVVEMMRSGVISESRGYLTGEHAANIAADRCPTQEEPLRVLMARGRKPSDGDPGLWLTRNRRPEGVALDPLGEYVSELTSRYQATEIVEDLVARLRSAPLTVLIGDAGSGKSTVAAALTRPDLSPGVIPRGFVHGIAFTSLTPTLNSVATTLAVQLARVAGFTDSAAQFWATVGPEGESELTALERLVVGPLRNMDWSVSGQVRLVIDGIDRMPTSDRDAVERAFSAKLAEQGAAGVRVLLTKRRNTEEGGWRGSHAMLMRGLEESDKQIYLQARGVPRVLIRELIELPLTWLDLRLLGDTVIQIGAEGLTGKTSLAEVYDGLLDARVGGLSGSRELLAILAASGTGPVLPAGLARAAAGVLLAEQVGVGEFNIILALLGALVTRTDPGTPGEHLGLFHETLTDHLTARTNSNAAHESILIAATAQPGESEQADWSEYLRLHLANHLWGAGYHSEAVSEVVEHLGPRAAENVTTLRPWLDRATALRADHPSSLTLRHYLAENTAESGNVAGAVTEFRALLADYLRLVGPDHPNTLATRHNLARWVGSSGDVAGAVIEYRELVAHCERVLGADHPSTLAARHNLARWVGSSGDVAGAVIEYRELVAHCERVLGADHPSTLTTRNNLAQFISWSGDVAAAVTEFRALLADCLRVLGSDHPGTLKTRGNFADCVGRSGNAADAVTEYRTLLTEFVRVLGPDHPDSLTTRDRLAGWIGEAGDVAAAVIEYRSLLADRLRVQGGDHPDTMTARANLADWVGESGDVAAAVADYRALLADRLRVLGADHPHTMTTRASLARWQEKLS